MKPRKAVNNVDILFTNSYTRSKDLFKEIYRYYYFKRRFMIICDVIFAFYFVLNAVCLALQLTSIYSIMIIAPIFLVFQIFCYFLQVNTLVKRDLEVYGKAIEVETEVTDSYIQNTASTGTVNKVDFGKIRYAVQTKNLILLHSKANLIYIFRKDAFGVGSKEEFVSFLKAKGIKVRGK